jgi:tetratricopeptide (TPR) repeat protein
MRTAAAILAFLTLAGPAAAQVADELSRRQALQHFRRGQELMIAERYDQAVAEFTTATELDPLLTLAHYGRGQGFMALKRYASAVQAFLGCRSAYEQIADLRQRDIATANILRTDEINELRDSMRRMQSEVRVNAMTAHRIAQRLEELEAFGKGGTVFTEAFRVPAELSLALGSAYFRNRQTQDAEREWKAAVAANPKLGEAHNNLAALYAMTERKLEARQSVAAAERAGFRVNPRLKADIDALK